MNDRQELKDKLWKLDEEVNNLASSITQSTGAAWTVAVEHQPFEEHLAYACNLSRRLTERLQESIFELAKWMDTAARRQPGPSNRR